MERARRRRAYRNICRNRAGDLLFRAGQAIDMLYEEGCPNVFERHRLLAEAVRRAVARGPRARLVFKTFGKPAERSKHGDDGHDVRRYDSGQADINMQEKMRRGARNRIGDMQARRSASPIWACQAPMSLGTSGVIEGGFSALRDPAQQGREEPRRDRNGLGESVAP